MQDAKIFQSVISPKGDKNPLCGKSHRLGHADMQTTEVYLRADPTEKIAALEAVMPPALRRGAFTVPDKLIASLHGK